MQFGRQGKVHRDHKMVVWRFLRPLAHRRPGRYLAGVLRSLGWEKLYNPETRLVKLSETTIERLAADVQKKLGAKVLRVVGPKEMKVTTGAPSNEAK